MILNENSTVLGRMQRILIEFAITWAYEATRRGAQPKIFKHICTKSLYTSLVERYTMKTDSLDAY